MALPLRRPGDVHARRLRDAGRASRSFSPPPPRFGDMGTTKPLGITSSSAFLLGGTINFKWSLGLTSSTCAGASFCSCHLQYGIPDARVPNGPECAKVEVGMQIGFWGWVGSLDFLEQI